MKQERNLLDGLSKKEVEDRIEKGQINFDTTVPTKTEKQIILGNIFTPFNILNLCLAILIILVQSYRNLLFLGVVICNCIIGIIQEIRSKRVVDKLSLLNATRVEVTRDGKKEKISISSIVLDDIINWKLGNQIAVDSIVIDGICEVNEAFLTGESDPIVKKKGDHLLSGSFVVSGSVVSQVEHVGLDNYTAKISRDAKYLKKKKSEIMKTINRIVKLIAFIIIPLGILFFFSQYSIDQNFSRSIIHTVAALVVMIPEGLVLLTCVVFAVSILRLSKFQVLVQELYCIETLARVDVLCLDKTGTLTEGKMEVVDIELIDKKESREKIEKLLGTFAHCSEDENATMLAVREKFSLNSDEEVIQKLAFSSEKKYSALEFSSGTYILGAPEFILEEMPKDIKNRIDKYSKDHRVLGFFHSTGSIKNRDIPAKSKLLCFLLIRDVIRKEAKNTLHYFKEQGVEIKVISGDSPTTVSNISLSLGIDNADKYIDMSTLKTIEEVEKAAETYTVFGRVRPEQKKQLVLALKKLNHVVAMTGDGVNDILALKEADCSIAMASGSDGARNVSDLILLDSNFDSLPKVVGEGRRSINNVERSSSLFLSKTIYATFLAIFFLFVHLPYPFIPIQLSLISITTIGIPSFALALEPNFERVQGKFFENVLKYSLPAALTVFAHAIFLSILSYFEVFTSSQISTLTVLLTAFVGFLLMARLSKPWNNYRRIVFSSMLILFISQFIFLKDLFSISDFHLILFVVSIFFLFVDFILYKELNKLVNWMIKNSAFIQKMLYGRKQKG